MLEKGKHRLCDGDGYYDNDDEDDDDDDDNHDDGMVIEGNGGAVRRPQPFFSKRPRTSFFKLSPKGTIVCFRLS